MPNLHFTVNQFKTAQARHEIKDGFEYLVVPTVLIQFNESENGGEPAAVLNGELLTMSQVCSTVNAWNGVPAPLVHPQVDGEFVSVQSNQEFLDQSPGIFNNAHCSNNALQGEFWIDLAKANELGGDALEAVRRFEAGQAVNVSSAYFRNSIPSKGQFNSQPYKSIAVGGVKPDHAAILLHQDGACDLNDGCGAPRANQKGDTMPDDKTPDKSPANDETPPVTKVVAVNLELSLTELDEKVWNAWWDQGIGKGRIFKILPEMLITTSPGKLWLIPYSIDDDEVVFEEAIEAMIVPVEEVAANKSGQSIIKTLVSELGNLFKREESNDMPDKKTLIEALVANERCPLTAEELEPFDEKRLQALQESFAEQADPPADPPAEPPAQPEPPPEPAQPPEPDGEADPQNAAVEQLVKDITALRKELADVKPALEELRANSQAEHGKLVAQLAASQRCLVPEDTLKEMDITTLKQLQKSILPPASQPYYLAQNAGGFGDEEGEIIGEMPMPSGGEENG